ncbi:Aminoglycoside phosphotransferase [Gracilaria domingensis]|nr:Aminoglycoside phosphotransferase [Gracilaria domingensis]
MSTRLHLVVFSAQRRSFLTRRVKGPTLCLPLLSPPEDGLYDESPLISDWRAQVDDLCSEIYNAYGIRAHAVVPLWYSLRAGNSDPPVLAEAAVLLELLDHNYIPSVDLEWLDCDAVLHATWTSPCSEMPVSNIMRGALTHIGACDHRSTSPWREIGWFAEIERWGIAIVTQHGMNIVEGFKQIKNMPYSTVLSCKVKEIRLEGNLVSNWQTDGSIYVKVSHSDVAEAKLTTTVSTALDRYVPKILAVDEKLNAFVQVGAQYADLLDPAAVVKMIADFHIASIPHIDKLRAGGVPDRGLKWLSSELTNILYHPVLELCQNKENVQSLRKRADELRCILGQLLSFGIPETLVHGDCEEQNVRSGLEPKHGLCFIDWANCCIAPPFFDLYRLTLEDTWGFNSFKGHLDLYFDAWKGLACQPKMPLAFSFIPPIFLCYNLSVLLDIYEMSDLVEKQMYLQVLEDRVGHICSTLHKDDGVDSCPSEGDFEDPNTYHFVIPSHNASSLLARRSKSRNIISLPVLKPLKTETSEWVINWDKDTGRLHEVVKAETGLGVFVLRPLWVRPDSQYGLEEVVLLAEIVDDSLAVAKGYEWISRDEALETEWVKIDHCFDIKEHLSSALDNNSRSQLERNRMPWRFPGWFGKTLTWIGSALSDQNLEVEGPVSVVRNTFLSCIMKFKVRYVGARRVDTVLQDNIVFVKAGNPKLLRVPAICAISAILPDISPRLLAVNASRNLYMEGNVRFNDSASIRADLLMKTLATFQKRSTSHLKELKSAGVPAYTVEWVRTNIRKILGYSLLDRCKDGNSVTRLRANMSRLELCFEELESYRIPDTLLHGDFHSGNVGSAVDNAYYHILDWNSAYIGHPFCDFAVMRSSEDEPEEEQETAEQTYFQYWNKYGNKDTLQRVSNLALIAYFCIELHRLQDVSEAVETEDYESVVRMCSAAIDTVLYGLKVGTGDDASS